LSVGDASALLSQSAYLLRDEEEIASQIDEVLERSRAEFAEQQIESTLELMNQAAEFEDAPNEGQETLIREVRRVLDVRETEGKKWH
jgi:tagatose-1,6-bisphosphate aldolase